MWHCIASPGLEASATSFSVNVIKLPIEAIRT